MFVFFHLYDRREGKIRMVIVIFLKWEEGEDIVGELKVF